MRRMYPARSGRNPGIVGFHGHMEGREGGRTRPNEPECTRMYPNVPYFSVRMYPKEYMVAKLFFWYPIAKPKGVIFRSRNFLIKKVGAPTPLWLCIWISKNKFWRPTNFGIHHQLWWISKLVGRQHIFFDIQNAKPEGEAVCPLFWSKNSICWWKARFLIGRSVGGGTFGPKN